MACRSIRRAQWGIIDKKKSAIFSFPKICISVNIKNRKRKKNKTVNDTGENTHLSRTQQRKFLTFSDDKKHRELIQKLVQKGRKDCS
jgi:hypothetical protein